LSFKAFQDVSPNLTSTLSRRPRTRRGRVASRWQALGLSPADLLRSTHRKHQMPGMTLLFDNDDPDASQGFKNLKAAAKDSAGGKIRLGLEHLWSRFEPYADKQFINEFGRHVEERFWEMYLGVRLRAAKR
jgi:hypothetical protein